MPGEARWIVSVSASSLHTALCLSGGAKPVEPKLASEAVAREAAALADDLRAVGVEPDGFFDHAIPLAPRFDSPAMVAEVALTKLVGPRMTDGAAVRLGRRIQALIAAVQDANPQALEELELRSGPLREQWEARGPGLLAAMARLTDRDVVVDEADVILVQPVLGGGGAAHPLYNSLHFEAVLADPHAGLPEVARLGWLWGQLNLDLPKYADHLSRAEMARVGPLALVPAALVAAQEVELARFDASTVEAALTAWTLPPVEPAQLVGWWETYQSSNPSWPVALGALSRMLAGE